MEEELSKIASILDKVVDVMLRQCDAQARFSASVESHIDRLLTLQEESAGRFMQTNDMVHSLIEFGNEQRSQIEGFARRQEKMIALHNDQAQRIEHLIEENTNLNRQLIAMGKEHEERLAMLLREITQRPTTNNIIQ